MPAIAQHAKVWFYQSFLFHPLLLWSLTSIQPFVCRNILANHIDDDQVTLFKPPGGFQTVMSVTFTLPPASSVSAAVTDPPLALWNAASMLLLFRWGDPRVLMQTGDRLRREPPPASLSYPLSARVDHVTPRPPSTSVCHRTVVVKLNFHGVIFFWIEGLTTCPTMPDAI